MKPNGVPVASRVDDDADEAERRDAENQGEPREALQLYHQDDQDDRQHERHLGNDRGVALVALLQRAADPR